MPAEYYLDTIRTVFQDFALVNGTWKVHGDLVRRRTSRRARADHRGRARRHLRRRPDARAAHGLCSGIPEAHHFHYDAKGAGHYGIFSGRRWRENVYPEVRASSPGTTPRRRPRRPWPGARGCERNQGQPRQRGLRAPIIDKAVIDVPDDACAATAPFPARAHRRGPYSPPGSTTRCRRPVHALRLPGLPRLRTGDRCRRGRHQQCPAGGAEGIRRLAAITGRPVVR